MKRRRLSRNVGIILALSVGLVLFILWGPLWSIVFRSDPQPGPSSQQYAAGVAFTPPPGYNNSPAVFYAGKKLHIVKTPKGDAPEAVRELWNGMNLPLANFLRNVMARGVVTGEIYGPRDFYAVDAEKALKALEARNPQAAQWFRSHVSPGYQYLLFEINEGILSP